MEEKIEIFKSYIEEIYPDIHDNVIENLKKKPHSFRVNYIKASSDKVIKSLREQGFTIDNGPFENSYIATNSPRRLSETEEFNKGLLYIQELSSMIPPILLDPKPSETILDISAAPGSKTTQIALLADNKANILAIDKNIKRVNILKRNIQEQDSKEISVLHGNGIKFDKRNPQYIEFFDKALVDAPCSSEGRFDLDNPKTYKYWNIKKRRELTKIQKGLLISAFRMLKPGGFLIYSTCTFGIEENEMVVDWLLNKVENAEIENIKLNIENTKPGFNTLNLKTLSQNINKSVRIIPNEFFGGFYLAKIRKVS